MMEDHLLAELPRLNERDVDCSEYRGKIVEALGHLVITGPTRCTWFGARQVQVRHSVYRSWDKEARFNYFVYTLQTRLYTDFYCAGRAVPSNYFQYVPSMAVHFNFSRSLAQANSGTGSWEEGWRFNRKKGRQIFVEGSHLGVWASEKDILLSSGVTKLKKGAQLCLRLPKGSEHASPGYYMAFGDQPLHNAEGTKIVRIYFNLKSEGADRALRAITEVLNSEAVPFQFKVLDNPAAYNRCDAGVLYFEKSNYQIILQCLLTIYAELVPYLKESTPVFTKRLAYGMGLAEDPNDGQSFGLNRTRLLAEGIVLAYRKRSKSILEKLDAIEQRFSQCGLNLDSPYLNPDSVDSYDSIFPSQSHQRMEVITGAAPSTGEKSCEYLTTAVRIAEQLSREAIWHQGRCNWLASELAEEDPGNQTLGEIHKTLGAELYAGTSGIAIFLAEAYRATKIREFSRVALGAIRHSLAHAKSQPCAQPLGLFTGLSGVVLATAWVGYLLQNQKVVGYALDLARHCFRRSPPYKEFDLLGGNAGAIPVFLILNQLFECEELLPSTIRLGEELVEWAIPSQAGCSWRSHNSPSRHNLIGLSHGTSGVAYALLELFRVTRNPNFRAMADRAFEYERFWFDAKAGNWPHLDETLSVDTRINAAFPFVSHWCHGAPGIALTRLRANQILTDTVCKEEAIAGLRATSEAVEEWLDDLGNANFSLCHGLTGNAEVLLNGTKILSEALKCNRSLAIRVADTGIQKYGSCQNFWPCGAGTGEHPGLMLGLAGIGYFYLRMHNQNLPSLLLIEPEVVAGWLSGGWQEMN